MEEEIRPRWWFVFPIGLVDTWKYYQIEHCIVQMIINTYTEVTPLNPN